MYGHALPASCSQFLHLPFPSLLPQSTGIPIFKCRSGPNNPSHRAVCMDVKGRSEEEKEGGGEKRRNGKLRRHCGVKSLNIADYGGSREVTLHPLRPTLLGEQSHKGRLNSNLVPCHYG